MRRASAAATAVVFASLGFGCSTHAPSAEPPAPPSSVAKFEKRADTPSKVEQAPSEAAAPVATAAPTDQPSRSGLLKVLGNSPGDVASALTGGSGIGVGSAAGVGGLGLRGAGSGGGGSLGGIGSLGRGGQGAVGPFGARGLGAREAESSREDFGTPAVNGWVLTSKDHLSTFGADVDTASYTLARAKLMNGVLPPADSVRVEEWVNYFAYTYPQPEGDSAPGKKAVPLAVTMNAAPHPFAPNRTLLRVGVQGRTVAAADRKPAHLTFLVDVSGSMQAPERLPLAKRALYLLVDQLRDQDTVSLVTYAGGVRLVLPHTGMAQRTKIREAIEALTASGSTAMSSGIELAYQQALKVLDSKSISRVIVLSDGDANVGATSHQAILQLIKGHVSEGVTVTTVGFGMGNYKSQLMEQLADQGNGNHYYVDSLAAAKRIFVDNLGGTLEVIAQDVKLQVDFDPAQVNAYRLVGYENRDIADHDFRNDRVDAGEIGSGHRVTALYELDLKAGAGQGLATVRVRAKAPRGTTADEKFFVFPAQALASTFDEAPPDFRFASAVMGAAEIFRRSPDAAEWNYGLVQKIAAAAIPSPSAERMEFLALLERAQPLVMPVASR